MTSRTIPPSALTEMNKEATGGFPLVFLTVTHKLLVVPIRVVSDPKDFVLDGDTFQGFEFKITLLTDTDDPPRADLVVQNVDRILTQVLHDADEPARLKLEVIYSDQFNLNLDPRTEIVPAARMYLADELYLTNVEVDPLFVRGTIRSWDFTQELWPGQMATKSRFPSLFR